ncbi:MAG: SDR family NAD(P)-dependent oxidoreductase, partial [Deltaproteobacteria bacterium]|nr:SDR family NAD(P)-dependent oxidoreductase [Deltaproteobacteria bacterium]
GLLIYISSTGGRVFLPFLGIYSASKFALEALAESYSYELSSFGVETAIIEPGVYPTPVHQKTHLPGDSARLSGYGELAQRSLRRCRQIYRRSYLRRQHQILRKSRMPLRI